MFTGHAAQRSQSRSIPPFAVMLFEAYGATGRHKGADVIFMDKRSRRRIARDFGGERAMRMIEPLLAAYAVARDDSSAIRRSGAAGDHLSSERQADRGQHIRSSSSLLHLVLFRPGGPSAGRAGRIRPY